MLLPLYDYIADYLMKVWPDKPKEAKLSYVNYDAKKI